MADIKTQSRGEGTCRFAAERLRPLIRAFSREIGGVKAGADSEYIHRMRVASRRLRAALPLFDTCFPEKKFRRWMQEIKKITNALGEARDADVQIGFLLGYADALNKQKERETRVLIPADPVAGLPPVVSSGGS